MDDNKQTEQEMLQDILKSVTELINEIRNDRCEIREEETELKQKFANQKISPMRYEIEMEQIRRSVQDVEHNLRSFENQRKITIEKLRELEEQ